MDGEGLAELFAPFAAVAVKRMFGGHGVYLDGLCFAIEADGEVYVKADEDSRSTFVAAGSSPFVYVARGRPTTMAYWRLVASAYDDEEELKRWAALGVGAARRAAAIKASKADKTAGATGRGARGKKTTR
ncbi:MAG: TfoX/Sxy family protein [Roseiarcus sp.]